MRPRRTNNPKSVWIASGLTSESSHPRPVSASRRAILDRKPRQCLSSCRGPFSHRSGNKSAGNNPRRVNSYRSLRRACASMRRTSWIETARPSVAESQAATSSTVASISSPDFGGCPFFRLPAVQQTPIASRPEFRRLATCFRAWA